MPLRLIDDNNGKIFWQNPNPSSIRYCRPIKFEFKHENVENTKEELQYIQHQIDTLIPTNVRGVVVKHDMIFSMIDGKVCNAITDTKSTQRCSLCGLTSKQFNNLDSVLSTSIDSLQ